MFHCNGWTYPWAVTAVAGTHVCLRRVDPAAIFAMIAEHRVTHLCGAPIVLNLLVHAPDEVKRRFDHVVEAATGGAAPPSAVIEAMERMGFRVTHLYGLTESYGPSTVCAWQEAWDGLPLDERAGHMARQGVRQLTLGGQRVVDPATMADVPADGVTIGELVLRSNTLMKGYLENPAATAEAFDARLVSYRRSRGHAPRRLCRDQGPRQGHHHLGRRKHLLARSRGGALPSPAHHGGGGRRPPRPEMGRKPVRVRDPDTATRRRSPPTTSSPGAAPTSPTTRCRGPSCSGRCRRPRPARSRNSNCANAPRRLGP